MASNTISSTAGRYAIHAVGGDQLHPYIGTRAECIRHALRSDGDIRRYCRSAILHNLPTPEWWILETIEDWAIRQLPINYPGVIDLFLAAQGSAQQKANDLDGWVDDWLLNGEKSRRTMHTLFTKAQLYLGMLETSVI